jgi:hypothetical protein
MARSAGRAVVALAGAAERQARPTRELGAAGAAVARQPLAEPVVGRADTLKQSSTHLLQLILMQLGRVVQPVETGGAGGSGLIIVEEHYQ